MCMNKKVAVKSVFTAQQRVKSLIIGSGIFAYQWLIGPTGTIIVCLYATYTNVGFTRKQREEILAKRDRVMRQTFRHDLFTDKE